MGNWLGKIPPEIKEKHEEVVVEIKQKRPKLKRINTKRMAIQDKIRDLNNTPSGDDESFEDESKKITIVQALQEDVVIIRRLSRSTKRRMRNIKRRKRRKKAKNRAKKKENKKIK